MNCEWVKANVIDYIYDELADDARYELEHHIERCAGCATEVESARLFKSSLSVLPRVEPSPNLLASARMHLQEALETTQQGFAWQRFFDPAAWLRQVKFSPALAAVILMVGFGAGVATTFNVKNGAPAGPNPGPAPIEAAIASIRSISQEPGTNRVQIQYDTLQRNLQEGSMEDPRIQELLLYAARNNPNSGLRMDSVELLTAKPEDNRVREALMYSLRYDRNTGVRLKALEGLRPYVSGDVRVRDAILEALVNDPNPGVRTQAIQSLQAVSADGSVRVALEGLAARDKNEFIRKEAGRVLNALPEID
ncbi:MAG: HEAT repeat domain-containing protein, partial [Terriglobales bacterium]